MFDQDPGHAGALAGVVGAKAYASLTQLLDQAAPHVVHVCTPAGSHFLPAREALDAGCHVYAEKPFVEAEHEARELIERATARGKLLCAGHQQLRDPAYLKLLRRMPELGSTVQVDSAFAFDPPGLSLRTAGPRELAARLLDILPHPLSTLIATLERVTRDPASMDLTQVVAEPTDLHAVVRMNGACGRLSVSLRARPVASTLVVAGTGGRLMADFVRTSVAGAANPGTTPVEKVFNPLLEAWQLSRGAVAGVTRRLMVGGHYPGLVQLIGEFYAAVARKP